MSDAVKPLEQLEPAKEFLVAVDSDGCAIDAMGIKQRECFCPWMIAYFGLQPVAAAARECKEFADLFSKTRGANRHKTIVRILTELLPSHPMVIERGFEVPKFPHYFAWVNDPESLLSNDGLKKAVDQTTNAQAKAELGMVLDWSIKVNEVIKEIVKNVPPFPYVLDSLKKASQKADIIVCSATPCEALEREWAEHRLAPYVRLIAGQEMGTKAQHLAAVSNGKYDRDKVLMLGDALGDMNAAKDNGVLFYPVNPGREIMSWKRFDDEIFDKFIAGGYTREYQGRMIAEFDSLLPEHPSWVK